MGDHNRKELTDTTVDSIAKVNVETEICVQGPKDSYVIGAAWNDMISSYKSSLSCSLLISSLCTGVEMSRGRRQLVFHDSRSNSKNWGSRGGATGSSSGSCCNREGGQITATETRTANVRKIQGMGVQVPPQRLCASWDQMSKAFDVSASNNVVSKEITNVLVRKSTARGVASGNS
jgi:hypothetical protein